MTGIANFSSDQLTGVTAHHFGGKVLNVWKFVKKTSDRESNI